MLSIVVLIVDPTMISFTAKWTVDEFSKVMHLAWYVFIFYVFFFQFSFPNITLSQQVSCPAVRLLLVRWNRSWRIWRRRKGCSQYGTGVIKQYKWLLRDFPYNSAIVWVGDIMTPAIRLPDLCCFSTCLVVCSWPWMQVDVAISKLFLVCRRRHLRQNASEKHIGNGHSF